MIPPTSGNPYPPIPPSAKGSTPPPSTSSFSNALNYAENAARTDKNSTRTALRRAWPLCPIPEDEPVRISLQQQSSFPTSQSEAEQRSRGFRRDTPPVHELSYDDLKRFSEMAKGTNTGNEKASMPDAKVGVSKAAESPKTSPYQETFIHKPALNSGQVNTTVREHESTIPPSTPLGGAVNLVQNSPIRRTPSYTQAIEEAPRLRRFSFTSQCSDASDSSSLSDASDLTPVTLDALPISDQPPIDALPTVKGVLDKVSRYRDTT